MAAGSRTFISGRLGLGHLSAILSVVTDQGRGTDYYHALLNLYLSLISPGLIKSKLSFDLGGFFLPL